MGDVQRGPLPSGAHVGQVTQGRLNRPPGITGYAPGDVGTAE